jgi:hypothetical protein
MNTISGTEGTEGTGTGTGTGTDSADSDISTAAKKKIIKKNNNQIYLNRHINFMMQPNTFQ